MTFRSTLTVLLIVYALLLALGVGLGSAYWAMSGNPPLGGLRLGPWRAWPTLGSPVADPYMRAILARRGEVPLAAGEGLKFTAITDSEGRALDSACSYRIGSTAPAARVWTLSLYDGEGRLPATALGRRSFTSSEVVRDEQGRFDILLSRGVQEGNWIQLPPSGRFMLALRLYEPPGAAGSMLDPGTFPAIERLGCGA